MDRWVGKIAMVTGASYGIGAAIAEFLVDCGLLVVGVARSKEKLDELAKRLTNKKGKLYSIKVDMMQEKEILEAFKWTTDNLGPISILINNAAVLIPKLLTECPTEDLTKMFDTNIKGLCISTREAIRIMRENKIDGHIIQLSSIAGRYVVSPETGIYSSTKHAVTALVESIRRELQLLNTKIKISVKFLTNNFYYITTLILFNYRV